MYLSLRIPATTPQTPNVKSEQHTPPWLETRGWRLARAQRAQGARRVWQIPSLLPSRRALQRAAPLQPPGAASGVVRSPSCPFKAFPD
eukprot:1538810-Rhodomonas_salina.4